jgi:D-alanyl-D-alanine dipeptidase
VTFDVTLIADPRVLAVPINERGDALVELRESGLLRLDPPKREVNPDFGLVREGLFQRLVEARDRLPEGIALLIVEGYRPVNLQTPQRHPDHQLAATSSPLTSSLVSPSITSSRALARDSGLM